MNEKRPLLSERSVDLDEAPDVTEDSARDLRSSSSNVADRDHGYNLARVKALLYKSRYYVPVVMWLPNYDWRRNLGPDVLAGLCVSAILIPQAISYALIVGIPPIYGMYTAFYPALVYFFMGQSMQLSMGPDAVVSIMVGVVVEESELDPLVFVQLLAFGIGVFVLALGLMRLGFLDVILSRPLLAGFINAVALEIILNQLDTLFGVPNRKIQGWHKLEWLFANFDKVRPLAIAVGCACIAALLAFKFVKMMAKKRWPRAVLFPDMLLVVGTVIAIVKVQGLNETHGLDLLGDIGSGLVAPSIPQFEYFADDVDEFTRTVLVVGLLGFIESIVCCKVYVRH
jgi:MFS superfamily sulfate permease-like transporter